MKVQVLRSTVLSQTVLVFLFFGATPSVGPKLQTAHAAERGEPLLKHGDGAVEISKRRYLTAGTHTPWQILHGVLAFRGDYEVKDETGRRMNAVEWISQGQTFNGKPWFKRTRYGGTAQPYTRSYVFQGHPNQFLAMMALADFPLDHELTSGSSPITVRDLVNHAKMELTGRGEITWTLWALVHYLGPDATWSNKYGQTWSIEKLVGMQTRASTWNAACGGTHALFALAFARKAYQKTGRPLRGVWLQADHRIRRYIASAKAMQNRDGSFSSQYFRRRGYSRNFAKRLSTSGHMLEFLMMALPDDRLNEQWVRNGVASVARDLTVNKGKSAEPGALYHALHGLLLYRQRVSGEGPTLVSAMSKQKPVAAPRPRGFRPTRRTAAKPADGDEPNSTGP